MGKKHESKQHQTKKQNKQKITVNLNLKHAERINKWVKSEDVDDLKKKYGEQKISALTKMIAQQRAQQNRENRQEYFLTADFLKFAGLKFNEMTFIKTFSKMKVVSIGPDQREIMNQIVNDQEIQFLEGKKIIFKSDFAHIHVVKLNDEKHQFAEYAVAGTEGTDIQQYSAMLNGLFTGNEEGIKFFDEIVERWG